MRFAALGHTTKQHKSSTLRRNSSRSNYPANHPGHFAVDVTRCDNLVWDVDETTNPRLRRPRRRPVTAAGTTEDAR